MARVLVVDDDLDVRESLSEWLGREHVVSQVAGVPEALAAIGREPFDVVITDFELPPYRGDDFLATVAENHPNVGRFMHTGSPGRALGFAYSVAHRVFKKGCDLVDVSRAIRDFMVHAKEPNAG
jgi:DNA-binding NtrC family response regulator